MVSSDVRILGCPRRSGTVSSLIAPPFHRSTRAACGPGVIAMQRDVHRIRGTHATRG